MDASKFVQSRWLKALDIEERVKVKIQKVSEEIVNDKEKLVLYFEGREKGLVLNRTNSLRLVASYGKETDSWIGKEIELYRIMTTYKTEEVAAVRIQPM